MAQKSYVYQDGPVRREMFYEDNEPDKFGIHTSLDADNIIETNKALAEEQALTPRATNKLLARVPVTVYEQSVRENWDDADWKRYLNDPDNAKFRVWKGRV